MKMNDTIENLADKQQRRNENKYNGLLNTPQPYILQMSANQNNYQTPLLYPTFAHQRLVLIPIYQTNNHNEEMFPHQNHFIQQPTQQLQYPSFINQYSTSGHEIISQHNSFLPIVQMNPIDQYSSFNKNIYLNKTKEMNDITKNISIQTIYEQHNQHTSIQHDKIRTNYQQIQITQQEPEIKSHSNYQYALNYQQIPSFNMYSDQQVEVQVELNKKQIQNNKYVQSRQNQNLILPSFKNINQLSDQQKIKSETQERGEIKIEPENNRKPDFINENKPNSQNLNFQPVQVSSISCDQQYLSILEQQINDDKLKVEHNNQDQELDNTSQSIHHTPSISLNEEAKGVQFKRKFTRSVSSILNAIIDETQQEKQITKVLQSCMKPKKKLKTLESNINLKDMESLDKEHQLSKDTSKFRHDRFLGRSTKSETKVSKDMTISIDARSNANLAQDISLSNNTEPNNSKEDLSTNPFHGILNGQNQKMINITHKMTVFQNMMKNVMRKYISWCQSGSSDADFIRLFPSLFNDNKGVKTVRNEIFSLAKSKQYRLDQLRRMMVHLKYSIVLEHYLRGPVKLWLAQSKVQDKQQLINFVEILLIDLNRIKLQFELRVILHEKKRDFQSSEEYKLLFPRDLSNFFQHLESDNLELKTTTEVSDSDLSNREQNQTKTQQIIISQVCLLKDSNANDDLNNKVAKNIEDLHLL